MLGVGHVYLFIFTFAKNNNIFVQENKLKLNNTSIKWKTAASRNALNVYDATQIFKTSECVQHSSPIIAEITKTLGISVPSLSIYVLSKSSFQCRHTHLNIACLYILSLWVDQTVSSNSISIMRAEEVRRPTLSSPGPPSLPSTRLSCRRLLFLNQNQVNISVRKQICSCLLTTSLHREIFL